MILYWLRFENLKLIRLFEIGDILNINKTLLINEYYEIKSGKYKIVWKFGREYHILNVCGSANGVFIITHDECEKNNIMTLKQSRLLSINKILNQ